MPPITHFDLIVMMVTGGVFVVGLWSTVFAFLYGLMKRLDKIILLLEANHRNAQQSP